MGNKFGLKWVAVLTALLVLIAGSVALFSATDMEKGMLKGAATA